MQSCDIHFISDKHHIHDHAATILASPSLGVDTEFVRERTFFPRPGLVQISDGSQVWLLDPIALVDQPAFRQLLRSILENQHICKILHSTGEDLEVLEILSGTRPSPLFDTQRAAAFLGWPLQVRYENLVRELLGIDFPGGLARNDWCRRPLPENWLTYAAHDVIALPQMHESLQKRLVQHNRHEWLQEDCHRLVGDRSASMPVSRIRSAASLSDDQLERLARLANWREIEARQRDVPRSFVVADAVLLNLAQGRAPDDGLGKSRGRYGPRIHWRELKALYEILEQTPETFIRPPDLQPLNPEQRSRVRELQAGVRAIADRLGIEPAAIASKRDLTRLVQGVDCDWMNGWRGPLLQEQ